MVKSVCGYTILFQTQQFVAVNGETSSELTLEVASPKAQC